MEARAELGWSQVHLASQAGLSRPVISEIENEKVTADDDTLQRLSRALGRPLPDLGLTPASRIAEPSAVFAAGFDMLELAQRNPVEFSRQMRVLREKEGDVRYDLYVAFLVERAREAGHPKLAALVREYTSDALDRRPPGSAPPGR